MRRGLPSPALVIACVALFIALTGAGAAATFAFVKAPQAVTLISGSVSANGQVTGARVTGHRTSEGVYTLMVSGFAGHYMTDRTASWDVKSPTGKMIPPTCDTASEVINPGGTATVTVDCFTYDAATGWAPTDTAFDFVLGLSR